ncbi:hypothetical protein [Salicibibacter halophilus]|nr:hypothetical protein [Salicibibacter halophilus]
MGTYPFRQVIWIFLFYRVSIHVPRKLLLNQNSLVNEFGDDKEDAVV